MSSEQEVAAARRAAQAAQRLALDRADDVAVVVGELLVRHDVARREDADAVYLQCVDDEAGYGPTASYGRPSQSQPAGWPRPAEAGRG